MTKMDPNEGQGGLGKATTTKKGPNVASLNATRSGIKLQELMQLTVDQLLLLNASSFMHSFK